MKAFIVAATFFATTAAFACPQFFVTNATCTDEGETFPVDQVSLQGNTFTLSAFGQVMSQTLPSIETVGDYTMKVECSGNSVITTETLGGNTAVAVTTLQGNSIVTTGESMILECVNGDCDNGPYIYMGKEPDSFSCSW